MKKIKILLLAFIHTFVLQAQTAEDKGIVLDAKQCKKEADAFRKAMPKGRQHDQSMAVLEAYSGQPEALMKVRKSRSQSPVLRDGVVADEVSPIITMYRPADWQELEYPMPILIYLHGGGWAFGSRNSCAKFCMEMATRDVVVLDVEYSLAPDCPFPAALDDVLGAIALARANAVAWGSRPELISVGGDSAGGNLSLAAALALQDSDATFSLNSLVLFYPVVKAYADNSYSWNTFAQGYGLDAELMDAFNVAYASGREYEPLVSPAHASDEALAKLPAILLIAADRDVLRDQGQEFAARISNLGVSVQNVIVPNSIHLFITVDGQPTAFQYATDITASHLWQRTKERIDNNTNIQCPGYFSSLQQSLRSAGLSASSCQGNTPTASGSTSH